MAYVDFPQRRFRPALVFVYSAHVLNVKTDDAHNMSVGLEHFSNKNDVFFFLIKND